mmetsp:Transcript_16561/g.43512  ORF Transcript_16561/g.43512 Transcript_16561/m.43512 type:complete len:254 (+) Transcript_16561:815-1576(+)
MGTLVVSWVPSGWNVGTWTVGWSGSIMNQEKLSRSIRARIPSTRNSSGVASGSSGLWRKNGSKGCSRASIGVGGSTESSTSTGTTSGSTSMKPPIDYSCTTLPVRGATLTWLSGLLWSRGRTSGPRRRTSRSGRVAWKKRRGPGPCCRRRRATTSTTTTTTRPLWNELGPRWRWPRSGSGSGGRILLLVKLDSWDRRLPFGWSRGTRTRTFASSTVKRANAFTTILDLRRIPMCQTLGGGNWSASTRCGPLFI